MRVLARVPSMSTPGRRYAIRGHDAGNVSCECVRFGFAHECSHVAIWLAAAHALARCAAAGHVASVADSAGDEPALCAQCLVDVLAASALKVRRSYVPAAKLDEVKEKARAKVTDIRERAKRRKKR